GYVRVQSVLSSQSIGVLYPAGAGQVGLISLVAHADQQHFSQLGAGYIIFRSELVVADTSDDAVSVAEVDVAFRPVAAVNIAEVACANKGRSVVVAAIPDRVDHLSGFCAGNRCI